jgi:hypothetical protein
MISVKCISDVLHCFAVDCAYFEPPAALFHYFVAFWAGQIPPDRERVLLPKKDTPVTV